MPQTSPHISIPKQIASNDARDFWYLRDIGMEHIRAISGKIWTDHNLHDPGITTLEVLCYAITDLGYRLSLPIGDLLSPDDATTWQGQFILPDDILPTQAVTVLDYRKLFIDLPGIRNAWIVPVEKKVYVDCKHFRMSYDASIWDELPERHRKTFAMKGLYEVIVDLDGSIPFQKARRKVFDRYHSHRNLCEDLLEVREVEGYPVKVCALVELEPTANEEWTYAEIEKRIGQYFSPEVRFYGLQEMFGKGHSLEEILEGPLLSNGFLDDEEVNNAKLKSEVRLSDIIRIIMEIPGVKLIKDIEMGECNGKADKMVWLLNVPKGKKPYLCNQSKFNFFKGLLPLNIDQNKLSAYRRQSIQPLLLGSGSIGIETAISLPPIRPVPLEQYKSVRNDFPDTYGVGRVGLPLSSTPERKGQAAQFKAYLQFFDQVLATYFKQLSKVKNLLSLEGDEQQSLFSQVVDDLGDTEEYLGLWYTEEMLKDLMVEPFDEALKKRNQLLDHLLARFSERFSDYVFVMKRLFGDSFEDQTTESKSRFLRDYATLGMERGTAMNFYRQPPEELWDTENISGLEKRVSLLAGFRSYLRRHLSRSYVEVYTFKSTNGNRVFRWRIYDNNRSILLSATQNYTSTSRAYEEIYMVLQQVIQIEPDQIEAHFEATEELGYETADVGCFRITKSPRGRYSFSIINPAIQNPRDPNRIIASQYRYYAKENIKGAILSFKRFIKESFIEEGIFLVEHILLRPSFEDIEGVSPTFMPFCKEDCESGGVLDPYSFRVSIIIPGNTFRFADMVFRDYLENLIREELPAHILAKICWIGNREESIPGQDNPLVRFEEAFRDFLLALSKGQYQEHQNFVEVLSGLRSIYPTGSLFDCETEDDGSLQDKIIVGRTNLGSI
ncbi:hypothetical protein [Pleomorphovibrio marinus]|uniref:hypothetical protein n=1 Tax=Pleomorphovibrio marinus TaxID=2164132 RepID=UPI000E0AA8B3|nr:hypothetical protein [Pleomorphovibrio marinus]